MEVSVSVSSIGLKFIQSFWYFSIVCTCLWSGTVNQINFHVNSVICL